MDTRNQRADVLSWAGQEDVMFIDLRITAPVGGTAVSFRAFDRLLIDSSGGIGPFLGRRRFLR